MVLVIRMQTHRLIDQEIRNEVENIIQFIVIGSEADASSANLIRLINSMGSSKSIDGLFLVESRSSKVLAATENQYINGSASNIPIADVQWLLNEENQHFLNKNSRLEVKRNNTFLASAYILNEAHNGLRKINIILIYNVDSLTRIGFELMQKSVIIGGVLIIAAFLIVWFVQRRYLLKPISDLVMVLNNQDNQKEPELCPVRSEDELGALAKKYNELAVINHNSKLRLEAALDKAELGNLEKIKFLSNVSHELRTPMNSIIGFTDRVIKKTVEEFGDKELEAIKIVNRNSHHLLELINNILDLSKIDAQKLELNLSEISVGPFLAEIISGLEPLVENKGLGISLDHSDKPQVIIADAMRIRQVFTNIISNAIKYTDEGAIQVRYFKRTDLNKEQMAVEVVDTGIGIRTEDQERLFKRFEQFDENSRFQIGHGSGIGLSLALDFVRLHQGTIELESNFGEGSIFRIILPITGPTSPDD